MALFQKKPEAGNSAPRYSIGSDKTILIIGLGNPGAQHIGTRHNIGFEAVELFAEKNDFPAWVNKKDLKCMYTSAVLGSNKVILCKPITFMNDSGEAAQAMQHFYRVYNPDTVAVYDELSIPFGTIRTRVGGEAAGHNGIKSLSAHLGDDFGRIRIGIGSDISAKAEATNFVLGNFSKAEQELKPQILRESSAILTEYIFGDQLPHETRKVL